MKRNLVHFLLWLTVQLGRLPLPLLRRVGWALGWLLYLLLAKRRRVVHINLTLCFPRWSAQQRLRTARRVFVLFAQSWLDRGWMWHGD
jgi:KDO2-lipid IV(A) lauroyltransferase